jgi:hypothetical protein
MCYWIVRVVRLVVPRYTPDILDEVPWTALVVIVKVILVAPNGMVAEAGT